MSRSSSRPRRVPGTCETGKVCRPERGNIVAEENTTAAFSRMSPSQTTCYISSSILTWSACVFAQACARPQYSDTVCLPKCDADFEFSYDSIRRSFIDSLFDLQIDRCHTNLSLSKLSFFQRFSSDCRGNMASELEPTIFNIPVPHPTFKLVTNRASTF